MSGPDAVPTLRAWWSPAGWTEAPEPDAYKQAENDTRDPVEALLAAGYFRQGPEAPEGSEFSAAGELCIYKHADHLYVEVYDSRGSTEFFVAARDDAAFRMTLLPPMLQAMAAVWQADELRIIRRAIVAFVRHGHGSDVISASGHESRDEAEERRGKRVLNPGSLP